MNTQPTSEYTLANSTTITDADIDQLCTEFESESWTGHLERIHYAPSRLLISRALEEVAGVGAGGL